MAIYEKSLKLSVYDFRQFGIASITTRTVSDINTIQIALISAIQMILPVPVVCVVALVLCFRLDVNLGFTLLAVTVAILIIAALIMKSAAPLFRKLQKLLDRMSTVLLENLTGVRVVRAFNNEQHEDNRMTTAFSNYARTSIKANRLFANLDGLSFFFVNLFVVIVYRFSGTEIYAGNLQIGDITVVIEYALFIMFFLMMAQMVIITLPRALVKKPELYIFDDSFSALDFKTDAALRHALAKETGDAAVLIIAQRVSTIRHADQIVVINEGGNGRYRHP